MRSVNLANEANFEMLASEGMHVLVLTLFATTDIALVVDVIRVNERDNLFADAAKYHGTVPMLLPSLLVLHDDE